MDIGVNVAESNPVITGHTPLSPRVVGIDKWINLNSKNVVEHLAGGIDKVDWVQNGKYVPMIILEGENQGAILS